MTIENRGQRKSVKMLLIWLESSNVPMEKSTLTESYFSCPYRKWLLMEKMGKPLSHGLGSWLMIFHFKSALV